MPPDTNEALARRLERLETDNMRLKRGAFVLTFGACVLLAGGAAMREPRTLKTESLVIVDKDGNERARFATSPDGYPFLSLHDEKGRRRLYLAQNGDGRTSLTVSDAAGKNRLQLGVGSKGNAFLTMHDEQERERVNLGVAANGSPGLDLNNSLQKRRAGLSLDAEGNPSLSFTEGTSPHLHVKVDREGRPSVDLYDSNELRGHLGVEKDSTSVLVLKGEKGVGRAEITSRDNGEASFRVVGADGKPLYQAPNR